VLAYDYTAYFSSYYDTMQTISSVLSPTYQPSKQTSLTFNASITHLRAEELAQLIPRWKRLTNSDRYAEPFYQPEWFHAYATAFEPRGDIVLATAYLNTELAAIAPLLSTNTFFGRAPARTYRSLSGIHSCRYDIMHRFDGQSVCKAIWRALYHDPSWQVIEVLDVPEGATWYAMMKLAKRDGYLTGVWPTRRSPYLSLPPKGQDPFINCPTLNKSYRARLSRKLKQLSRHGDVSVQVETGSATSVLSDFMTLELRGWKGSNGSAIACKQSTRHFYEMITHELAHQGNLRAYTLRVGSKAIAMQLGFAMSGRYFVPKIAYDENFAKFSPGQLLWNHVISDLPNAAIHTVDFLGPQAAWKSVWTDKVRPHTNCYIFRPSLYGRLLHVVTMKFGRWARSARYAVYGNPHTPPGAGPHSVW
jgi:CelD/BcsL family acetyltransferase involved in cellulose biosynthesis